MADISAYRVCTKGFSLTDANGRQHTIGVNIVLAAADAAVVAAPGYFYTPTDADFSSGTWVAYKHGSSGP